MTLFFGLSQAARAEDSQVPVTALVPDNAILVLQVTNPKALIDRAFDEQIVSLVQSLPPYQQAMSQPETQQVLGLVRFFEGKYGAKLPELLGKLVGGGITVAVCPGDQVLLIVEAEDATMLQEVHDFFRTMAQGQAATQGDPDRVKSAEYRDIQGWTFAPNEVHAIVGNRFLLANKPELMKAVLDRNAEGDANSLAKSANYAAALKSVNPDAKVNLYVDMQVLKQVPGFQEGLAQNENPLGRLLFAPLLAGAAEANWLMAGMNLDQNSLNIDLQADRGAGEPTAMNSFALPSTATDGAMPNLVVPRQIAALSFYRDLHKFYASKDELFPERTSGLIFFENMMGIFFTGKDLTEEVLAQTLPDMRFVVAEQKYDDTTGTPAMQLPGFAMVLKLRDPDNFYLVMEEAWQKAIGLVNFTSGQKALPGLIIKNATHRWHDLYHGPLFRGGGEEQGRGQHPVQFPAGIGHARRSLDHEFERCAGSRLDRRAATGRPAGSQTDGGRAQPGDAQGCSPGFHPQCQSGRDGAPEYGGGWQVASGRRERDRRHHDGAQVPG